MGEALSKHAAAVEEASEEESEFEASEASEDEAAEPPAEAPPQPPAAPPPGPGNRRRVKATPRRVQQALVAYSALRDDDEKGAEQPEQQGPPPAAAAGPAPLEPEPEPSPQPQPRLRWLPDAPVPAAAPPAVVKQQQQLLGLTILTLGCLLGMAPFAAPQQEDAAAAAGPQAAAASAEGGEQQAPADSQLPEEQPTEQGVAAQPSAEGEAAQQLQDAEPQAQQEQTQQAEQAVQQRECPAGAPFPAPFQQHAEGPESPAVLQPLSADRPLSRSQLRQQLLLSRRPAAAAPRAGGAAVQAVGVPAASAAGAAARGTRGQRLLGMVRQQQNQQQPAQQQPLPEPEAAGEPHVAGSTDGTAEQDGAAMAGQEAAGAGAPAEDVAMAEAQPEEQQAAGQASAPPARLAQRRLTQSPYSLRGQAAEGCASRLPSADQAEAAPAAEEPAQASPAVDARSGSPGGVGGATPQPQRTSPPTPATIEPSSTPRPGGAGAGQFETSPASPAPRVAKPCESAQSPSGCEGGVDVALQQVGALLVDLRADSPQPHSQQDVTLAPGAQRSASRLATALGNGQAAGGRAAARGDDEAESAPKPVAGPSDPDSKQPCSPPEVCSKPREAGADNFPGFWRQPVVKGRREGSGDADPAAAGVPGRGRKRARTADDTGDEAREEAQDGGLGRERRVRFSVPEQEAEASGTPLRPAQQQAPGPVPLPLAPPVLPSSSGAADGRPGTPAKPVQLAMPQPPAFSRFGAAAFRRSYMGPQGRRQALLSFVCEGGSTCFAVPSGLPADPEAPDGSDQQAGTSAGGEMVIPRRLQHKEGLGRRRPLLPSPPAAQGPELLEQEVREAFMNARLAGHAGEPWARLDMAGCELQAGGGHAEALTQLSGKLEEAQGPAAVKQLLDQLDAEWQHLKRMRQYAVQGAAPAGTAAAGEDAARPKGILRHRSSFSGAGQPALEAAAQAAAGQGPAGAGQSGESLSFAAVLAADIVQDVPAAVTAPAGQAAASAGNAAAPAGPAGPSGAAAGSRGQPSGGPAEEQGPAPMDVDGGAGGGPEPAAPLPAAPAASQPEEAGTALPALDAPTAEAEAAPPADAAAGGEPGAAELQLTPRPVELNPGPELSRGAKLLARCTPGAAGKVQQLLQSAAGEGRKAGPSPLAAAPIKLLASAGGVGPAPRRALSRGERLLASLRGTAGGSAAPASQHGPAAGEPGQPEAAAEEGPTVAAAASVLLGS